MLAASLPFMFSIFYYYYLNDDEDLWMEVGRVCPENEKKTSSSTKTKFRPSNEISLETLGYKISTKN